MKKSKVELIARLTRLGFTPDECSKLRRIESTLRRWFELECGTGDERVTLSIEREGGEDTGKPFLRRQFMGHSDWVDAKHPIADRETAARKRLAKIMASHRRLKAYVQGDPRGCAVYILRRGKDIKPGDDINSVYSRGFAVCE